MMAGIDPKDKKRLQEDGLWKTYLTHREVAKVKGFRMVSASGYTRVNATEFREKYPEFANKAYSEVAALVKAQELVKGMKHEEGLSEAPVLGTEEVGGSEGIRKAILWVFHNLSNDNVDYKSAPSSGAVGLLMWVNSSDANTGEFYTKMLAKVIPTKLEEQPVGLPNDRAFDLVGLGERLGRDMEQYGITILDGSERDGAESKTAAFPVELGAPEYGKR